MSTSGRTSGAGRPGQRARAVAADDGFEPSGAQQRALQILADDQDEHGAGAWKLVGGDGLRLPTILVLHDHGLVEHKWYSDMERVRGGWGASHGRGERMRRYRVDEARITSEGRSVLRRQKERGPKGELHASGGGGARSLSALEKQKVGELLRSAYSQGRKTAQRGEPESTNPYQGYGKVEIRSPDLREPLFVPLVNVSREWSYGHGSYSGPRGGRL